MHFNRFTVVRTFTKSSTKPDAKIRGNLKFEPRHEECTTAIYNNPRKSEAYEQKAGEYWTNWKKYYFIIVDFLPVGLYTRSYKLLQQTTITTYHGFLNQTSYGLLVQQKV